jgi:DNA-binding transcriptional regulator/RsmH inhibitor MraZ
MKIGEYNIPDAWCKEYLALIEQQYRENCFSNLTPLDAKRRALHEKMYAKAESQMPDNQGERFLLGMDFLKAFREWTDAQLKRRGF